MEFQQTKKQRHYKEWLDSEGLGYRITWYDQFAGVSVTPVYYACVKVIRISDGAHWWEFAWLRRPFKTYKRAVEACRKHRRLWEKFVKLSNEGMPARRLSRRDVKLSHARKVEKLKELDARGRVNGANMLGSLPVWVQGKAEPSLVRIHFGHEVPPVESA